VNDEELVLLARQGDTHAFDQLIERHQVAVYRAALAALGTREEAEEVAQDAFVRAYLHLNRFRGESSFKTWLLRIAWRRALTRRRSLMRWVRQRVAIDATSELPATTAGPERQMLDADLHRRVRRLIAELPPKLRDAFLLAQSGEYSYDDIAAMLETPVGTLKWRISDARRRLRAQLTALGYSDER
jgi:RNA polymerase sigma-70 factor (ECF subfamily)